MDECRKRDEKKKGNKKEPGEEQANITKHKTHTKLNCASNVILHSYTDFRLLTCFYPRSLRKHFWAHTTRLVQTVHYRKFLFVRRAHSIEEYLI